MFVAPNEATGESVVMGSVGAETTVGTSIFVDKGKNVMSEHVSNGTIVHVIVFGNEVSRVDACKGSAWVTECRVDNVNCVPSPL